MQPIRTWVAALSLLSAVLLAACSKQEPAVPAPAAQEAAVNSRTEFTNRVENYFEYEPLHGGKAQPDPDSSHGSVGRFSG